MTAELTDLEICEACARAVEIDLIEHENYEAPYYHDARYGVISYWPLTNKAQAMDLEIALKMSVQCIENLWCCSALIEDGFGDTEHYNHKDLLRAVATCAAKIQLAKESK